MELSKYLPSSCNCERCQSACRYRPGWFLPEEIDKLLEHFKAKDVSELLGEGKFAIDWWTDCDEELDNEIMVLAPNVVGNDSIQYPANPRGVCVFFKDDRCSIHEVKPFECSTYIHAERENNRHEKIAMEWKRSNMLEHLRDKIEFHGWSIFDEIGII